MIFENKNKKPRVVIAMSGGVDSSVAAALLKKQGFDCVGIFMKLWAEDRSLSTSLEARENICCSVDASTAARAVAEKLGIPFYIVNFEEEFKKTVVDYYIKEYEAGRTPNPCVICNRDIKGEILMRKMKELGGDFLATGHYARIKEIRSTKFEIRNKFKITRSKTYKFFQPKDKVKDQTYFLWTLTQEKLAHLLFPCGNYTKPQIRKMAEKWGLPTAKRRESQGICFIPDRDVAGFLKRYAKNLTEPGEIENIDGQIIGKHQGLINYTIGQREGLGLGGPKSYYVVKLDSKNNILVVGEDKDLFQKELMAGNINWINSELKMQNSENSQRKTVNGLGARIRHGHPIEKCTIEFFEENVKVKFDKPQRAITPGQSIVFYRGEEVLGGGIIQ